MTVSSKSRPKWLNLFHCFTINPDTDRAAADEDPLTAPGSSSKLGDATGSASMDGGWQTRNSSEDQGEGTSSMGNSSRPDASGEGKQAGSDRRSLSHRHGVKRVSVGRCESACSASSTSEVIQMHADWSAAPGSASASPHPAAAANAVSSCRMWVGTADNTNTEAHSPSQPQQAASSSTDAAASMQTAPAFLLDSQEDNTSCACAASGSMICGAVAAAASCSPRPLTSTAAECSGSSAQGQSLDMMQSLEFKHPTYPSNATNCCTEASIQMSGTAAGASSSCSTMDSRRGSESADAVHASNCSPGAAAGGFGIYSALVAERRAKVAAQAASARNQSQQAVTEPIHTGAQHCSRPALNLAFVPDAAPGSQPPFRIHHSSMPRSQTLDPHKLCAPIAISLSAATSSTLSAVCSPTASQCGIMHHPTSPLCGIPETNTSAFLCAMQHRTDVATPANLQHLLTPSTLKALNAVIPSAICRQLSSGGSSLQECTLAGPSHQQQAAAAGSKCAHYPPQPAAASQQLLGRFPLASQHIPVAPSRLGLQPWQQPQEQAPCDPHLASRVEALRLKLRAQAAELRKASEQQGKKRSWSPTNGAAVAATKAGARAASSRGRGCGAAMPLHERAASAGLGTPALNHALTSSVSGGGLRCCRTMDVEEAAGEEEEERNRHESTMSYLRMLSRSNTSFCTRLRRSHTQTHSLRDSASPPVMSACSSAGTRRSILGVMGDD